MHEFNLHKIGRKSPYTPPKDGFFEAFSRATLDEIDRRAEVRRRVRVGVATSLSAAAAVAVVLWGGWNMTTQKSESVDNIAYGISYVEERFSVDVKSYVGGLSDEEIESVLSEIESDNIFYSNL